MRGKIVEIKELEKTLTGFQNVPKGDANTAYVFFQSKDNSKYVVSTEERKIMSAQLRRGKYDRIMTISRGEFMESFKKEIACEEQGHSFFARISIRYFIKDPEIIYLNHIYQMDVELGRSLSDVEIELGQIYGFRDRAGLKRDMEKLVKDKLGQLSFLQCSLQLEIDVDETAKAIIEREQEHKLIVNDADLSVIEEQVKMENSYDLEQLKLEREKEVARLQAEVQSVKVDSVGDLIRKYGINAGNMIGHVNGEITGSQLSAEIAETLRKSRSEQIEMISNLYDKRILSKDMAEEAVTKLLGTNDGGTIKELLESKEDREEEQPETETFQWNDVETEDGTIE